MARSPPKKCRPTVCPHFARRLIELTSCQQQTQRTLLDWLQVESAVEKPSNKLLAVAELDYNTWAGELKRLRGKNLLQTVLPSTLRFLLSTFRISALAAETLTLERTLSDLVNRAYALTPAEIDLMWKTAPPRMPISEPATLKGSVPETRRT